MAKRKYTRYEKMHFVKDYKESGLDINEYCSSHSLNYFEFKAWRANYLAKINDAGDVVVTSLLSNPAESDESLLQVEEDNGLVCFSTPKKKQTVLVKQKACISNNNNTTNNNNNTSNKSIKTMFLFRDSINECCIKLLDLSYSKSNSNLVEKLMEVLT